MESEIEQTHISSDFFDRDKFQKQLEIIKQASETAQEKINYFSAHDDNIIRAIDVVEEFLRKKHRLCYGGQAINAHLPAKYKFYDPESSIPDYDFFTPQQNADITTLVKELRKAGFTEISAREGMHEGTIKIYVDYIPVADMTAIDPKLYKILSQREFKLDGISYLDANTLRMLMYLELSRPRGEVSRWGKVFERLALFNEFVSSKPCHISREAFKGSLTKPQTEYILNYIINNKRVFAGADLVGFYNTAMRNSKKNTHWILSSKKPIIFFSSEPDEDAKQLRAELNFMLNSETGVSAAVNKENQKPGNNNTVTPKAKAKANEVKPITIKSFSSSGVDLIPSMKILTQGTKSLVFIINQTACHSYFNISINSGKIMKIASLDTLITLYFSLGLFDSKYFDMGSMECLANELVEISIKSRNDPDRFVFPFISVKCAGHQTSLPSLIRAKVKRITQKKQGIRNILKEQQLNNRRKTVYSTKNRANKTSRANKTVKTAENQLKELLEL